MKRTLLWITIVLLTVVVAYGYTATRRERVYRKLVFEGDYALERGDTFEAVTSFSDAIALKPDSMLGYLKRGQAHRRRGDLEQAAADLERASTLDPASPRALELYGDVEAARQHHERAAEHYAGSVKLDDRSPRVLYKLGLARHLAGLDAAAAEALDRAATLDPRFAEAHYLLGVCLSTTGKPREAEQALKRALALDPSLHAAREALADVYDTLGRRSDRIAELERLAAADPSTPRQIILALAYASASQTERAVRQLRNASQLYPADPAPYLALGRVWLARAQADNDRAAMSKAMEALQQAVLMDPSSPALALLGRARLLSGDAAAAERTLRHATERLPVDASAFLDLAEASRRMGHGASERRALRDYKAIEPR
jgi:tetratricopeptide (TPR) repeat protein